MIKEKIIEKATEIYQKYGNDDLDYIAHKLGAKVFDELKTDVLKEVYFPDIKAIAIKPNLHPYERRYLIAHALGHHLFHRNDGQAGYIRLHEKGLFQSLEQGRIEITKKEWQADLFASYLLIPEEKLNEVLQQEWVKESINPIPQLAEEFNVPEEVMKRRMEFKKSLFLEKILTLPLKRFKKIRELKII